MRRFTIRLADLVVQVATLHDETYALCRDYLCDDSGFERPDIVIATDRATIDRERELDKLGDFDDSYYETLAVYRAIAEGLPVHGRLLVHGSAVAIEGRAWLFMAASGTGKSTHTRWWRTEFADERPYMVNDDKPIIRLFDDGVRIMTVCESTGRRGMARSISPPTRARASQESVCWSAATKTSQSPRMRRRPLPT